VEEGSSEALRTLQWTIERLSPWYHNISFAGVKTNGVWPHFPDSRWRLIEPLIPADLTGKTVLDIGCNSGFFAIEMKKRGAKRVIGIDIAPFQLSQARFNSHWHALPIELYDVDVYQIEELNTKFDIILFLGVLYHLKHPLYALEKLAAVCTDTMLLISSIRGSHGEFDPADDYPGDNGAVFEIPDYPRMYFVEKKYNGDDTNWWLPNHSCLKAMARTSGFPIVESTTDPQFVVCKK
jgi:tRNA (mo5U34)-methyltransferase